MPDLDGQIFQISRGNCRSCRLNGTLYRVWESENGQNKHLQIVMPRSIIPRVLHNLHDRVSNGHLGVTKTVVGQRKIKRSTFYI